MDVLPLPTEDIIPVHWYTLQTMTQNRNWLARFCCSCPEIVVQTIEERALATTKHVLPFWFHYVDDKITALNAEDIDDFHTHINKQNSHIQFTKDVEENVTLPYKPITTLRQVLTTIKNKKKAQRTRRVSLQNKLP